MAHQKINGGGSDGAMYQVQGIGLSAQVLEGCWIELGNDENGSRGRHCHPETERRTGVNGEKGGCCHDGQFRPWNFPEQMEGHTYS